MKEGIQKEGKRVCRQLQTRIGYFKECSQINDDNRLNYFPPRWISANRPCIYFIGWSGRVWGFTTCIERKGLEQKKKKKNEKKWLCVHL